mgnify:CR=1 FL=1
MVYNSNLTNLLLIKKLSFSTKRRLIGSIFPKRIQFENKKVRTVNVNPILHKTTHLNRVNRKNKKGINLKKKIYPVVYTEFIKGSDNSAVDKMLYDHRENKVENTNIVDKKEFQNVAAEMSQTLHSAYQKNIH